MSPDPRHHLFFIVFKMRTKNEPENRSVGGSIPPLGTKISITEMMATVSVQHCDRRREVVRRDVALELSSAPEFRGWPDECFRCWRSISQRFAA